jgi:hypothetical protein
MRWLNAIAWAANLVGTVFGLYFLLTAIDRNTQGEYIDEARALDYGYSLLTFVAGFLAGAIATAIVVLTILLLAQCLFLVARWLLRRST